MAKSKRPLPEEAEGGLNDVHPSRQKRVKYSEDDAKLAKIFDDLADEVQTVRIKAASDLLKLLSIKSGDQDRQLEQAQTRLIRGLCSGRKAARLGFSIALSEVYRLKFNAGAEAGPDLLKESRNVVKLTLPEGNISGQERRDYLLGQRYGFQALLQSDVANDRNLAPTQWRTFLQLIIDLANQKPWLRRECGNMLHEYLISPSGLKLENSRVQSILDVITSKRNTRTPEAVGLWLTVQERFPQVVLPKGTWHHNDPLSSKERPVLAKIMLETITDEDSAKQKSGSRQSTPSFAWSIVLSRLYERHNGKDFAKFWTSAIAEGMFTPSSSTERKALGLQVVSLALLTAPTKLLSEVLHEKVLRCVIDQRASDDNYLFSNAKNTLNQIISRAKQDPTVVPIFVQSLLENGSYTFDQATKTKTIDLLLHQGDQESWREAVNAIFGVLERRIAEDHKVGLLADLLLDIVRKHKHAGRTADNHADVPMPPWMVTIPKTLAAKGYAQRAPLAGPTKASQAMFRARAMSCLACFIGHSLVDAVETFSEMVNLLVSLGEAENLVIAIKGQDHQLARAAAGIANNIYVSKDPSASKHAFALLFYFSIVQVYDGEPDSVAALRDLMTCYQSFEDGGGSATVLVELLLSFVSKPSALFRKLGQQVFSAFAPSMTDDSLQSLIDILGQKESLSGQQELFADQQNGEGSDPEAEDSGMDVEDLSDVELVNGEEVAPSTSDAEDSSDNDSSASSSADGNRTPNDNDDEELAFDRKLAEALGTNGPTAASDSDGSDMDDEQMLALEPHLTSIFAQRRQTTSKKREKQDARTTVLNFKTRVLDLLTIYVKSQTSNILTLDLILPLVSLIRTTTSKPLAEKSFAVLKTYFETCTKQKTLPVPSAETAFALLTTLLHDEIFLDGAKLHVNACSRASLFLCRVLVAMDGQHYDRLVGVYAECQRRWWREGRESKVQGSVFTEWVSWSIAVRKR